MRRLENKLVDIVNSGLAANTVELFHEIRRKKIGKFPAHRVISVHAGKLFQLAVPAFHPIFEIGRQNSDVDRFDDILAEFLQPLVLRNLALERAVERRVFNGDADISG